MFEGFILNIRELTVPHSLFLKPIYIKFCLNLDEIPFFLLKLFNRFHNVFVGYNLSKFLIVLTWNVECSFTFPNVGHIFMLT